MPDIVNNIIKHVFLIAIYLPYSLFFNCTKKALKVQILNGEVYKTKTPAILCFLKVKTFQNTEESSKNKKILQNC